ncbi:hypothetical protein ES703_26305 [subsurface metagenome]
MVILWFGSVASIPNGWQLCDGTGASPDLRNVFLLGAGGAVPVGLTGGASPHTHLFMANGHTHDLVAGADLRGVGGMNATMPLSAISGTTDPEANLPPYKALCYLMKL